MPKILLLTILLGSVLSLQGKEQGDFFTYRIHVEAEEEYTLISRIRNEHPFAFTMELSGLTDTIVVEKINSAWGTDSTLIRLPEGDHILYLRILPGKEQTLDMDKFTFLSPEPDYAVLQNVFNGSCISSRNDSVITTIPGTKPPALSLWGMKDMDDRSIFLNRETGNYLACDPGRNLIIESSHFEPLYSQWILTPLGEDKFHVENAGKVSDGMNSRLVYRGYLRSPYI